MAINFLKLDDDARALMLRIEASLERMDLVMQEAILRLQEMKHTSEQLDEILSRVNNVMKTVFKE